MLSPDKFKDSWIDMIKTLYKSEAMKDRVSSISVDDFSMAIDKVKKDAYALTPLCLIYFRPGVIGSNMHYHGIPVVKVVSPPPIDLGIPFQYQTVYIQPLDELVLAALGYVLLNQLFPDYLHDKKTFGTHCNLNLHLEQNSEVTKKAIAGYVCRNAPYDYVFALVCFYMLTPFVYCIDQEGLLFPPIECNNSFIPREGGPSLHYSATIYPVQFLYDFVSLVYQNISNDAIVEAPKESSQPT